MKNVFQISALLLVIFLSFSCSDDNDSNSNPDPITVTDADGNVYNTITIGNQVWMLENLKTTKYNDGTPITEHVFGGNDWHNGNERIAQYQWANTNDLNNVVSIDLPFDYYGAMYNHFAIETGKLAPQGWRIPSTQDFIELESYLRTNGFSGREAEVLKTDSGWLTSSGNGTNEAGFNGLPNGYVSAPGTPTFSEGVATWATVDVNSAGNIRKMIQLFDEKTIQYIDNPIQIGAGIRCIKE